MRKVFSLNKGWKFIKEFNKAYTTESFQGEKVQLPHSHGVTPLNYFDESEYAFISTYQREIYFDEAPSDKKEILVYFEAIAHSAEVYFNGLLMGEHKGGYTGFTINLTSAAKVGKNLLTVKVDAREQDIPPFGGVYDHITSGGIYREAQLIITDRIHVDKVFVNSFENIEKRQLRIRIKLNKPVTADCACTVYEVPSGKVVDNFYGSGCGDFELVHTLKNAKLWSFDEPTLYRVEIIASGDEFSDTVNVTFGFRTAVFTANGFMLNGKKVMLSGLERRQSYPYVGYAAPQSMQVSDAELLKRLGVNAVRTSHCPPGRHFLDACDRLGIAVMVECAGGISAGGNAWQNALTSMLTETIEENYNHPSVVLWGTRPVACEDDTELCKRLNSKAKELDKTRQTMGIRKSATGEFTEDVYAYDDFSYNGSNAVLEKPKAVTQLKGVPYIVTGHTGHMYPVKDTDNVERKTRHAMRHLSIMDAAFADKAICGVIGSSLADYNTGREFGSGDGICYHGVTNMHRQLKPAAYAYMSQSDTQPFVEVSGTLSYGDYDAEAPNPPVVFSNCDEIKIYNHDKEIASYSPVKKLSHIPHAPFVLDNMMKQDAAGYFNVSKAEGEKILRLMTAVMRGTVTAMEKFEIVALCKKYDKTLPEWTKAAQQLVRRWGENDDFRVVGVRRGKEICEIPLERLPKPDMKASAVASNIVIGDTYEVVQVNVEVLSEKGNRMPYYNGAVSATCENAQFIGPRVQPIVGGKATFYLRVEKPGIVSLKLDGGLLGLEQVSVKITEKMEKLPDAPEEGQTELDCKRNSSVKEIYDLTLA